MNIENTIASIHQWHAKARPAPGAKAFNVQLGCHFEEVAEQLESLCATDDDFERDLQAAYAAVHKIAEMLKAGQGVAVITNRKDFIDSVADQLVTGVGVAHCAHMNPTLAAKRVDISNWSKYVNGEPLFDENGKIKKGPGYVKPDLEGCY